MNRPTKPVLPVVLFTHPFELALGSALAINGVRGLTGHNSPSVATLPSLPLAMYLVVSTIGGIGVVTGLLLVDRAGKSYTRAAIGLAVERSCLYLVAASYAGLGILLVGVNHSRGIGTAVVIGVVAMSCILRTVAIRRSVRAITKALRRTRLGEEGNPDA